VEIFVWQFEANMKQSGLCLDSMEAKNRVFKQKRMLVKKMLAIRGFEHTAAHAVM
jgi:hypothetical protein